MIVVASGGVVGGVAGLLGVLVGRYFKRDDKKYARKVGSIAGAIGAVVGPQLVAPAVQQARLEDQVRTQARAMFGSERVADVYVREGAPLFTDRRFRRWMQHAPKPQAGEVAVELANDWERAGAVLVARGMARLDDASLNQFFDVKGAMADVSDVVCAGFWSGRMTQADLFGAMHKLSDEQKLVYARATLSAMARELEASSPPARLSGGVVRERLQEIAEPLSPALREEFQRTLAAGERASPSEGCAAFKLLVRESRRQTPAARAQLVRGVSFPALVDWER